MSQVLALADFSKLFDLFGVTDTSMVAKLHADLLCAWAEPQRGYHTQQHLAECLELAKTPELALEPRERSVLSLVLWFHDAVYDPQAKDNEAASAQWAATALTDLALPSADVARVEALVMATEHLGGGTPVEDPLVGTLLDIDLAIMGSSAERFAQYEEQVRLEYAWVPEPDYVVGRAKVLGHFAQLAATDNLYKTNWGKSLFGASARRNLAV